MGNDFVWEVHDEEDEPVVPPRASTLHHRPVLILRHEDTHAKHRPHRSWRRLALVACLLLAAVASAGAYVANTAKRNLRLAQADLLAVMQTEARAMAQGDAGLYRSLQAPIMTEDMVGLPTQRYGAEQQLLDRSSAYGNNLRPLGMSWHGEHADVWVAYTMDGITYARLQGYQQVEGQWLRTDVDRRHWGQARTLQTAHFRFQYHEAEAQVVGFLARWAEALYANLDFGPQPPDLIAIELRPYLAQPLAFVGRRRVTLTSPRLAGIVPEKLRNAPLIDTLGGLSLAPEVGQELLTDITAVDPALATDFFRAVALALANNVADTDPYYRDRVYRLIAEAAAQYEVDRLVPALAQENVDETLLRAVLNEEAVLPVSALWTDAVVVASADDCNELSSIKRPLGSCYGRGDVDFRQALAQAKSLITFVEEQAAAWHLGSATQHFPLAGHFLAAVSAGYDSDAAIRYLFQEAAEDVPVASPKPALFHAEPQQFVEAWHAWLQQKYGQGSS